MTTFIAIIFFNIIGVIIILVIAFIITIISPFFSHYFDPYKETWGWALCNDWWLLVQHP